MPVLLFLLLQWLNSFAPRRPQLREVTSDYPNSSMSNPISFPSSSYTFILISVLNNILGGYQAQFNIFTIITLILKTTLWSRNHYLTNITDHKFKNKEVLNILQGQTISVEPGDEPRQFGGHTFNKYNHDAIPQVITHDFSLSYLPLSVFILFVSYLCSSLLQLEWMCHEGRELVCLVSRFSINIC